MKNGDVNYFLDTVYYNDHYVVFNKKKYFFNAVCTDENGISHFEIYKCDFDGTNFQIIYSISNSDTTVCGKDFIDKKIFDGKSFWEAEADMTEIDA